MREIHGKLVYDALGEIVDPKHTALLVVDVQNDTFTEGGHASRTPGQEGLVAQNRKLLPNMVRFVDETRKTGVFVVWIKNTYLPNWYSDSPARLRVAMKVGLHLSDIPYYQEGTWGWEIVDELKPLPHEPVVRKYRTTAFHCTFLDPLLRTSKIESVIVIGSATRACAEKTAMDATIHDYYSVMVKDCCAPYDETLVTGGSYDVATSEEVFREWAAIREAK